MTEPSQDDCLDSEVEDYDARAALTREFRLSESSKKQYKSKSCEITAWLRSKFEHELFDGENLCLDRLQAKHVVYFFEHLQKKKSVGISTYSGYRSALFNMFKLAELVQTAAFQASLSDYFKSLKRKFNQQRSLGERRIAEGKKPMPFAVYRWLCCEFLRTGDLFSHCYLVLSWNLICRTMNTEGIQLSHLSWQGDALGVQFALTKTDQEGEKPSDFKHIYANPLDPVVCPILSLALYLICNGNISVRYVGSKAQGSLFPGGHQSSRFSRLLKAGLSTEDGKTACALSGVLPEDIGTHSLRKGASTFVSNGSVAGPSITSLCLRAGWSIGDVLDRYLRFEAAGDQYVGRVVNGLPVSSHEFAVLHPYFHPVSEEVLRAVEIAFPMLYRFVDLRAVLVNCLASAMHHKDWLRAYLTRENHTILMSPLFSSSWRFATSTLPGPNHVATGVPPHVVILASLRDFGQTVESLPENLVARIRQVLEDAGALAGNITREHLASTLQSILESCGCFRPVQSSIEEEKEEGTPFMSFMRDGAFFNTPQNFRMPAVDVLTAWSLWWRGNPVLKVVPYRKLTRRDMNSKNDAKLLNEWKSFFDDAETRLRQCNEWNETPTDIELGLMIGKLMTILPITEQTRKKRKRRVGHLHLTQCLRHIRESKRHARGLEQLPEQ